MSAELNHGAGRCQGTARLLIKAARSVIELGASKDVLINTINAVHHTNRHAAIDDFIAIALPAMRIGRSCMLPGHEIELVASEASLSRFLGCEGVRSLSHRGMLSALVIGETFFEAGQVGAAYVRDRACEKYTPGWIRRSAARAERRGKALGVSVDARGNDLSALALSFGKTVIHVRELTGEMSDAPLMVSTYGFSSMNAPAILPVMPDSLRESSRAN